MSIDRLALVARVLYEQRILDQRQEIETLKLELFKRDHSAVTLHKAVSDAVIHGNTELTIPNCGCINCMKYSLRNFHVMAVTEYRVGPKVCVFDSRFENFLTCGGMTFGVAEAVITSTDAEAVITSTDPIDQDTYDEPPIEFKMDEPNHTPIPWGSTHHLTPTILPDVHFIQKTAGSWCEFQYGPKLLGAKTINNPEIQKLRDLFCLVRASNPEKKGWLMR